MAKPPRSFNPAALVTSGQDNELTTHTADHTCIGADRTRIGYLVRYCADPVDLEGRKQVKGQAMKRIIRTMFNGAIAGFGLVVVAAAIFTAFAFQHPEVNPVLTLFGATYAALFIGAPTGAILGALFALARWAYSGDDK